MVVARLADRRPIPALGGPDGLARALHCDVLGLPPCPGIRHQIAELFMWSLRFIPAIGGPIRPRTDGYAGTPATLATEGPMPPAPRAATPPTAHPRIPGVWRGGCGPVGAHQRPIPAPGDSTAGCLC